MGYEHDLRTLIDEFALFVQESADYQRVAELRDVLLAARQPILSLRRRLELARKRYVVAVVGLTNVGKSTLLNALFGHDLAPQRNGPCTAFPIEFTLGPRPCITVDYVAQISRQSIPCDDFQVLRQELDGLANDGTNGHAIRKVTVEIPHPILERGLTVADTPGFGAAQLGEAHGSHEKAVRQYLARDVAQVFWVTLAEQGIGHREQRFYDDVLADVCDDIVVTGCEDWDKRDGERFRRRFGHNFRQRIPTFHFVSGIERTGIPELASRIKCLSTAEGRWIAVTAAASQLASDVGARVHDLRNADCNGTTQIWRPDSWQRLLSAPTCDGLRAKITSPLQM